MGSGALQRNVRIPLFARPPALCAHVARKRAPLTSTLPNGTLLGKWLGKTVSNDRHFAVRRPKFAGEAGTNHAVSVLESLFLWINIWNAGMQELRHLSIFFVGLWIEVRSQHGRQQRWKNI
ncbi:hypothetical protein CLAIMM_13797 [Cladophialophora immunda]|nr:hypothetical protein CLAIMM_13797 [Cladophialophora immunda]